MIFEVVQRLVRAIFGLLLAALLLAACSQTAKCQTKFLGPAKYGKVKYSPKYDIPYDSGGFENPLKRKAGEAKRRGAPKFVVQAIREFPYSLGVIPNQEPIGEWIDRAWEDAQLHFKVCGGSISRDSSYVSARGLHMVKIRASIWYESRLQAWVAGLYDPNMRSIDVVNIYYGSTGDFRYAKTLLRWEFINYLAEQLGYPARDEARYQRDACYRR